MSILKTDYIQFGEDLYEIVPPTPTETDRGGIIASPKRESDVIEARLGDDGKLYVGSMDANLSNYYNKDEVDEIIETIKMIQEKVMCSRNTAYLILMDIDLFIADFNHYELEIIREGKFIFFK